MKKPSYNSQHMDERRFWSLDCIKRNEDGGVVAKLPYDSWADWLYSGDSVAEAVAYLIKMDRHRYNKYMREGLR